MTGLRVDTTQSILTLSAQGEVPRQADQTRTDPHAACRAQLLSHDRRHGDFWSKVLKTDCCWLWTRSRTGSLLYGAFWQNGRIVRAHRVAYELLVGPIPEGREILHECDVPHCVRPEHLRPATHRENQQDMAAKGRNGPQDGENNHHAKFTWATVHAIRERVARGERHHALAAEFGTSRRYIGKIAEQRVWPESSCPVHRTEAAA